MTPAVNLLKKRKVTFSIHQYKHDADNTSFGEEAAEKLGLDSQRVFKTLVVQLDNSELAVAIIPVAEKLSMKYCAKVLGAKKAAMAEQSLVEKATGYLLGGISPLGQKKRLRTLLNDSAMGYETIFISAGRRGLEIELSPQDLLQQTNGVTASICA